MRDQVQQLLNEQILEKKRKQLIKYIQSHSLLLKILAQELPCCRINSHKITAVNECLSMQLGFIIVSLKKIVIRTVSYHAPTSYIRTVPIPHQRFSRTDWNNVFSSDTLFSKKETLFSYHFYRGKELELYKPLSAIETTSKGPTLIGLITFLSIFTQVLQSHWLHHFFLNIFTFITALRRFSQYHLKKGSFSRTSFQLQPQLCPLTASLPELKPLLV